MNASVALGRIGNRKVTKCRNRTCSDWKSKHYSCADTWIVGMPVLSETRAPVKNGWDSDEPLIKEVPRSGSNLYLVSFLKLGESFQLSLKTRSCADPCVKCCQSIMLDFEMLRLGPLVFLHRLSGSLLAFPGLFCLSWIPDRSSV